MNSYEINKMEEIKAFKYLYSDVLKEHSNIFDRTPIAITWSFKGKTYKRENITDRLIADYSKSYNAIAVVEAPYSKAFNNVYIVNAENKLMINDFKKLLFNNIANGISNLPKFFVAKSKEIEKSLLRIIR